MNKVKQTSEKSLAEKRSLFQRICFDVFEFIGIVISLLAVGIVTLAIVLNQRDIPLDFLKPTLEEALGNPQKNISVEIGALTVKWPDIRSPIILQTDNIDVKQGESNTFFSIEETQIQLNFADLLLGDISIDSIRLYQPELRVIHLGDQEFVFSFAQEPYEINTQEKDLAEEGVEDTPANKTAILDELVRNLLNNPEALPPSYRNIRKIVMEDSSIQITDFQSGRTLRLTPADIKVDRSPSSIKAEFIAQLPEDYGDEASVVLIAQHAKESSITDVQLSLGKTNVAAILKEFLPSDQVNEVIEDMQFSLEGTIEGKIDNFSSLQSLSFSLHSKDLSVYTIKEKEMVLAGRYIHSDVSQSLILDTFTLDQLNAKAELNFKKAKDDRAVINAVAEIDDLDTEILDQYWTPRKDGLPRRLSRLWLVEKIEKGRFKDLAASVQLRGTKKKTNTESDSAEDEELHEIETPLGNIALYDWTLNWDNLYATLNVDDIDVSYADNLTPATNVYGKGEMEGKSLTISVEKAKINDLTVKPGGKLYFDDLVTKGAGEGKVTLGIIGTVPSVFNYLEGDPVNISKYVDIPFDQTRGDADLDVSIRFPTVRDIKDEDFDVRTSATFTNLFVPQIINGLDLKGGPFKIETTREDFKLSGDGELGSTAMTVDWHEYIKPVEGRPYKSSIQSRTRASEELRNAFNVDFRDYIPDPIPVDVTYVTRDTGPKEISFVGDLAETDFEISLLNYKKPKGNNGVLRFQADLNDNQLQKISRLELEGPSLDVKARQLEFIPGSEIPRKGIVEKFVVGKTDADLTFRNETLDPNERLKIDMVARSVDASKLINKQKGGLAGDLPALVIRLKSENMLLKNDEPLRDVELLFKQSETGSIENVSISSSVGGAPLEVRFRPDRPEVEERLVFKADNAGAALRALGLFKTMKGGNINLTAIPVPDGLPQEVQGRLYISDFTILDTPFIAKLVNSLSVEGIVNLLENKDLSFTQFKANIRTQKAENGDWLVIFKDAKTKGTSLGIAFDGRTNIDEKTLDINGHIIPASGLNKAIGQIPILGQILSGGDDAVFAANFSIKGPDTNPKVTVNPLSVLTPGFIRKFLFED